MPQELSALGQANVVTAPVALAQEPEGVFDDERHGKASDGDSGQNGQDAGSQATVVAEREATGGHHPCGGEWAAWVWPWPA